MRLLLDECIPVLLRHELAAHHVRTVRFMGWTGLENGDLLTIAAAERFDAFITVDKELGERYRTAAPPLAILLLHAPSNTLLDLRPLIPQALKRLLLFPPGP